MRIEEDFIGKVEVPEDAYFGIFTVRAAENFRISQSKPHPDFIRMLALVKKSCAQANVKLGQLDAKIGNAIIQASDEVAQGKHDNQFILDSYTAGAGTPFNMNMNEVIANRAEELLGGKKGQYKLVHPNNHVNMSQSSNDVIPTAIRLVLLHQSAQLLSAATRLADALESKEKEFSKIVKVGRTHLMDAVPLTVADELSAFSSSVKKDILHIGRARSLLSELPIGATALGSGINTHPAYKRTVVAQIRKNTGLKVKEGRNLFRLVSSASDFFAYSCALSSLALSIHKLSSDLKLLSSGPNTMVGEYVLPEVEPGSSIMPGKINPSIPECAEMIANRVFGLHHSVQLACAGGQLQLNVQTPLILHCLSEATLILSTGCSMLSEKCIIGMKLNTERIRQHLDASLITITALSPYFGYSLLSNLVKKAQNEGKSLKEIVIQEGLLSEAEFEKLLAPSRLVRPSLKLRLKRDKK
ncbi:MAG: aspartate ammonia-lyase [Candidatus Micrarchaeota archaeon]|nr:aspartate ammonia-lyase [Candidatus Micrarchaeota archaeon]